MHRSVYRRFLTVIFLLLPPLASFADVNVLYDLRDPTKTVFPSNQFSEIDFAQLTSRRVNLPKSNCGARTVECDDIDVLNSLDGFSVNPRVTVPFDGPIDIRSVTSDTVFLFSLGGRASFGKKIGINRIVWDSSSNTLYFKPDDLLEQQSRYAVIITDAVRDTEGKRIAGPQFSRFRLGTDRGDFWREVDDATQSFERSRRDRIVAASVFTTMSATTVLEKIRREVRRGASNTATFDIGNAGSVRAVFPVSSITNISVLRQTGVSNSFAPPMQLPLVALQSVPGAVGQLAFGKYTSPNFLASGQFIPPVATRSGRPVVQSHDDVFFNLFIPSGPKPASGWPVALFGHGLTSDKEIVPFLLAAKLAEQGIATMSVNFVGHGFGPFSLTAINFNDREGVGLPAGGRGVDLDGDGRITAVEGTAAAPPRNLTDSADALRQTAADFMQLVAEIQSGIDVDSDGSGDFDASRIYYFGQSFGGFNAALLLATEPGLKAGVLNVAGGPLIEAARLSPGLRSLVVAPDVALRNLANLPPITVPGLGLVPQFNENLPLRNQPPLVNDVAGAIDLQTFFDRREWATYVGSPLSFAPHIRKDPLSGNRPKSVIFQFARGDQTVPNPANSAIVRAGGLLDRTTYYRADLAVAANAATPRNPHTFLSGTLGPGLAPAIALQAQTQIATFFASDGKTVIDPDGSGPLFEVPIVGPLPEVTNFIP